MNQKYTSEVQNLYSALERPVTVLWGEQDEWIPFATGEKLAALISDCSCVPIRDSGHLVQEDRPEAIVAAALKRIADS